MTPCSLSGVAAAQSTPDVSTIAGSGAFGIPGGTTADSPFIQPLGAAVAPDGSVYVSDAGAQRIVRIANGLVSVVAGGGAVDASGVRVPGAFADGVGSAARFDGPAGLAFDGNALLIADSRNGCIRRLEDGVVTTFAGTCGTRGFADGAAASARFFLPMGLCVVPGGDVFVADTEVGVRKIDSAGRVTTMKLPFTDAYGLSYDEPSATLFVASKEGIFIIHRDALVGVEYGGTSSGAVRASQLSFGYAAGDPFGIVVLNRFTVLYSDAETGALRYLETYTGSAAVLSGSGTGGDFRLVGREPGPLGARSFVQPLGLALAADHGIIVADGLGRVVRRIAPWSPETLSVPADVSVPPWQPHRYRIALIGNSTIWSGATWYDSIENGIQNALDTPAFRAVHGEPEVLPFWIVGDNAFQAAADYGTFLVQNRLADAIVLQQSSMTLLDSSPKPAGQCGGLDFGARWAASRASTLKLGAAATAQHIPVVGVMAPAGMDVSPGEEISWTIIPGPDERCVVALRAQTQRFHGMLGALFGQARIHAADLWPAFLSEERRPDSRPLFGSMDGHFNAEGRALAAQTILPVLESAIAAEPK